MRGMSGNGVTIQDQLRKDRGVVRVIAFASTVIVFSMLLIGTVVYTLVEKQVVKKLKGQDLQTIAEASAAKVDARIERAKETALVLSRNPSILAWVAGGEKDTALEPYALDTLQSLARDYDYENSFIVSAVSNRYWAENRSVIDVMSPDKPENAWFYNTLKSGKRVSVVIDTNPKRNGGTFVFINVLMGPLDHPLGVAGVGLSLTELAREFESYKLGRTTHLWLIDGSGTVLLSDRVESDRTTLADNVPKATAEDVLRHFSSGVEVLEYENKGGLLTDLISFPVKSSDLRIVYTIERNETVAFLQTIKNETIWATLVSLIAVVFIFFYVSRRLANPYKRALLLNAELERQVAERTKQLAEEHARMSDSIDYAKRIQTSLLPADEGLLRLLPEHFVIWRPVGTVGGDFYWAAPSGDGYMVAVGDCTGHGVPGALMTMLAVSLLNQLASDRECAGDPARTLERLNRLLKETLRQRNVESGAARLTDDGLDIGLIRIAGSRAVFAGARSSLFVRQAKGLRTVKGESKSIGYRRTPDSYAYTNHAIELAPGDTLYLTTDGVPDQCGGEQGFSYGRRRFASFIERHFALPLEEQRERLEAELLAYMGDEPQRDDWAVVAMRPLAG
jgi:serine phosphatase RsbU (regulator of sigma subunit)